MDKNIGKGAVAQKQDGSYCFEELVRMSSVGEEALEYASSLKHVPGEYTIEDYRALPEDPPAEPGIIPKNWRNTNMPE